MINPITCLLVCFDRELWAVHENNKALARTLKVRVRPLVHPLIEYRRLTSIAIERQSCLNRINNTSKLSQKSHSNYSNN